MAHAIPSPDFPFMLAGDAPAKRVGAEEFERFVGREADRWLRLAVRLAGEADGPDVLQEALVKAWLVLSGGSIPFATDADASRWVVRVVVNQALDVVRARSRRRRWAGFLRALLPSSSSEGHVEATSSMAAIDRILQELTPEQRVAWVLKEVEGYSGAEIAAMVGASEGAVEQRLLRARAQLERRLRHEEA